MVRLKPFFSYYGSKYRLAPRYPRPERSVIIEPFAGSAAYSCLHYEREVRLYESNAEVRGLWRFLIQASAEEVRRIPLLGPGEGIDDLRGCCEEARYLVGFWLNKGTAHLNRRPGGWMRSGRFPDQFWGAAIRQRVAAQVDRIRHWRIAGEDYRQAPVEPATWFVDPPYAGPKGRYYYGRSLDYGALGDWCRTLPGQVLVCEAEGAGWLPFQPFATTRGTAAGSSREALWRSDNGGQIKLF